MLLTPNKLEWGTCPHCKKLLNCWDGIPAEAVGAQYWQSMKCPSKDCGKALEVRVRVTFKVEIEKSPEATDAD